MLAAAPQLPLDFFVAETPDFDNFIVGTNQELIAQLRAVALPRRALDSSAICMWGGQACGKSHLISALAGTHQSAALMLLANDSFPEDPFIDARLLCVDDADRLNGDQQAWLFTAFNHVAQNGGVTVVSGQTPPGGWALRDDIRTRLGSGLIFEIVPIPQDELPPALSDYAQRRGWRLSEEVLAYLLSHSRRDISSLCQLLVGLDRLSLALKRPVTVPLVRAFLAESETDAKH
jgi:DnaA-homolog protein